MRLLEFDSHPMLVSESNYKILKPLTLIAKDILKQFQYSIEREGYDDNHIMPFQSWAGNIDAARWFGNIIYKTVGPVKAVEMNHIDYWNGLLFGDKNSTGLGDNQNEYFILPKKVQRIE